MSQDNSLVFALDVGTRKVAGLLVRAGEGKGKVEAWSVMEHPERAMLDGQVHHVDKAARIIARVREDLEAKAGVRLEAAHVAVAGRALMTAAASAEVELDPREAIAEARVRGLELAAVRDAKLKLGDPRAAAGTHCVGYAITRCLLDGQPIGALAGHRGSKASVEVLATFLPTVVLDALAQALRLSGLGMQSLTLEPIAALHLTIPPDLRRLNLALVDVGAGTSDVAITRGGTVTSFFMAPLAGDEVTERLVDAFVLDFQEAERAKRQLSRPGDLRVLDLFGAPREIPAAEAHAAIAPAVADIARAVCAGILDSNGGDPPQAVLLVGGGSQTPGLARQISEGLGLPASRVGSRPPSLQNFFAALPSDLQEPWAVTPLGIALSACEGRGLPFLRATVNGQEAGLVDLGQTPTVFDALVAAGCEVRHFVGRPGLAATATVNGAPVTERGGMGTGAQVRLGGRAASFGEALRQGDAIEFTPGAPGADARLTVRRALELAGAAPVRVTLGGRSMTLAPAVTLNGNPCALDDGVPDGARLEAAGRSTVAALLAAAGHDPAALKARRLALTVNGEPRVVPQASATLLLNGAPCGPDAALADGDAVAFDAERPLNQRVADVLPPAAARPMAVNINGRRFEVPAAPRRLTLNGRPCGEDEFLIDGADLREEPASGLRLFELLARLGLDPRALDGGRMDMRVDGAEADGATEVRDGADILLGVK